jgi:hypothetical protein
MRCKRLMQLKTMKQMHRQLGPKLVGASKSQWHSNDMTICSCIYFEVRGKLARLLPACGTMRVVPTAWSNGKLSLVVTPPIQMPDILRKVA